MDNIQTEIEKLRDAKNAARKSLQECQAVYDNLASVGASRPVSPVNILRCVQIYHANELNPNQFSVDSIVNVAHLLGHITLDDESLETAVKRRLDESELFSKEGSDYQFSGEAQRMFVMSGMVDKMTGNSSQAIDLSLDGSERPFKNAEGVTTKQIADWISLHPSYGVPEQSLEQDLNSHPYVHKLKDCKWKRDPVREHVIFAIQGKDIDFEAAMQAERQLDLNYIVVANPEWTSVHKNHINHRKYPWQNNETSRLEHIHWNPRAGEHPSEWLIQDLRQMWQSRPGLVIYSEYYPEFMQNMGGFNQTPQSITSLDEIPEMDSPTYLGDWKDWLNCANPFNVMDRLKREWGVESSPVSYDYPSQLHGTEYYLTKSDEKKALITFCWGVSVSKVSIGQVLEPAQSRTKLGLAEIGKIEDPDKIQDIYVLVGAKNPGKEHWELQNYDQNTVISTPGYFGVYEELSQVL